MQAHPVQPDPNGLSPGPPLQPAKRARPSPAGNVSGAIGFVFEFLFTSSEGSRFRSYASLLAGEPDGEPKAPPGDSSPTRQDCGTGLPPGHQQFRNHQYRSNWLALVKGSPAPEDASEQAIRDRQTSGPDPAPPGCSQPMTGSRTPCHRYRPASGGAAPCTHWTRGVPRVVSRVGRQRLAARRVR